MGFMYLEKVYDIGDKLLNAIKSIYLNSLVCVKLGCENECFRIYRGVM